MQRLDNRPVRYKTIFTPPSIQLSCLAPFVSLCGRLLSMKAGPQ